MSSEEGLARGRWDGNGVLDDCEAAGEVEVGDGDLCGDGMDGGQRGMAVAGTIVLGGVLGPVDVHMFV